MHLENQLLDHIYTIDGDTMDFHVVSRVFGMRKERVRILECDAYELRGEEKALGQAAKAWTNDVWLKDAVAPKQLRGEFWEEDSFGRWLIRLIKVSDDAVFAYDLVAAGHAIAVPFSVHLALIRGVKAIHGLISESRVPLARELPSPTRDKSILHRPSVKEIWIEKEARRYGVEFDALASLMSRNDFVVVEGE